MEEYYKCLCEFCYTKAMLTLGTISVNEKWSIFCVSYNEILCKSVTVRFFYHYNNVIIIKI